MQRPGGDQQEFKFSLEDAKRAGLLTSAAWQKYPGAMLRARCISAGARATFPDAIMGCYTHEELGAPVIDVEGTVLETESNKEPEKHHNLPTPASVVAQFSDHPGPGDFVIGFGKFKGKKICEVSREELRGWVMFLTEQAKKDKKQISAHLKQIIELASEYHVSDAEAEMTEDEWAAHRADEATGGLGHVDR